MCVVRFLSRLLIEPLILISVLCVLLQSICLAVGFLHRCKKSFIKFFIIFIKDVFLTFLCLERFLFYSVKFLKFYNTVQYSFNE